MIIFNNWQISVTGLIARQYDNLSRRIDVEGDLPAGYTWQLLVQSGGNADTILLEATETGAGAVLTADNLSRAGEYYIQLRGILEADGVTRRHTNVVSAYIPESLTGIGTWPEVPTEFYQVEARILELYQHPPIPGSSGYWLVWDTDKDEYVESQLALPEAAAGGTSDHSKLKNRDAADQHPMSAITGLDAALAGKQAAGNYLTDKDLDTTLTVDGKAADAAAVGARLDSLSEEIANLQTSGLTTAQINALDGMFKVCAFTADPAAAYEAFRTAFGITQEGPDTPVETTYTITSDLVNVTSSNSATSVTEGSSYSATLTAAEGYELDTVSVLMGGVDVTADVYANGVISIPAVTGNVEIVASAIESEVTEALNTNGLVFNYDFRNSAMELYNLSGWGNVYRTVDQTGNSMIFGTTEATGDEKGLKDYAFRDNRLVSSETEKVKLGETYTVQALFRAGDKRLQPNLFGWGSNVVTANTFNINPKYLVGTTETSTTVDQYSHEGTQYIVITYVVSGESLSVYHNTDLVLTLDGNNYDNFTKWMDYGVPNTIYSYGYATAFVGYNRALTQSEIMDNIAFFKTLEVA